MGNFDIQRARGTLPGKATQVRADIDVRTGGQQVAQAVSGLGGSIADLGEKYYNIQATTQSSRAERLATEEMNRLSLSLEGNLDPETYLKEYDKSLETIQSSTKKILTNNMAASNFGLFLNDREPRWEKSVKGAMKARVQDNWTAELFAKQADVEQSGEYGDFSKFIAQGVSGGMIERSDAVREIIKARKFSRVKQEELLLRKYQSQMFELAAEKGYEVALEKADSPEFRKQLIELGLSAEAQQRFINILKATISSQKAKEKELSEEKEQTLLRAYQSQMLDLAANAGYEVALAHADSPEFRKELVDSGLPIEKHQSLINTLKASISIQQSKQKEDLEKNQEIDRSKYYEMLENKNYDDIYGFLATTILNEDEKDKLHQRANREAERIARGEDIITDQGTKHKLLDGAAAINWPERDITAQDVREDARLARYGPEPKIDDVAYDEVRDAIRKAEEDKIPFTQKFIETIIGELITGAPSSVLGLPLPTLRTREDAINHATNAFGRFVGRVPGVMDTINSIPRYAPKKGGQIDDEKSKGTPAYDFDGELIGSYNSDGSINLTQEGARRLWELVGRDSEKARQLAIQNRYILPDMKE